MSQFRSEEMKLVQLFIQNDAAYETLKELGALGAIQFKDLNSSKTAFQRTFVNNVRKCNEMERILRFLHDQIRKAEVRTQHGLVEAPESRLSMDDLSARLEEHEKELIQLNTGYDTLLRQHAETVELKYVLERCGKFFQGGSPSLPGSSEGPQSSLLEDDSAAGAAAASTRLGFIAGLVPQANLEQFGRVLFRATRGNMILRTDPLDHPIIDPKSGENMQKTVYIVFFSGERAKAKITKICDSFGANKYPFPENISEQHSHAIEVDTRAQDLNTVLERTKDHRYAMLARVALSLDAWFDQIRRDEAIYHTMNLFNYDITHKCLIAEGWCPTNDIDPVQTALRRAQEASGALVPTVLNVVTTKETPPTFFRNNKLTTGFQSIVDAYGIARYQEYNPAVFTIITFPFLFGVMFGDAGHGTIMTLFATILVLNENKFIGKPLNEMFEMMFNGRYVMLFMGIFAFYCGCVYNETFSIAFEASESAWYGNATEDLQKFHKHGTVYPFGVDPGWAHTANKLNFYNSLKMKISIILGVTQMVAGVCCKLTNCLFFNARLELFFMFIPEIIFINAIFGYLVIVIFHKWSTNFDERFVLNNYEIVTLPKDTWEAPSPGWPGGRAHTWVNENVPLFESNAQLQMNVTNPMLYNNTGCAEAGLCSLWKQPPPALLDMLIKMFMSPGHVEVPATLYSGQGGIQLVLVLLAVASVPVLLLAKPLLEKRQHEEKSRYQTVSHDPEAQDNDEDAEHFDFGEVMVHQIIHTIEYVLGCISNTASYLRLWALSLAHAQLSEVFWEKLVVEVGFEMANANPIALFVTVYLWACLTFSVLMAMESLSAFLHALRLHWVEFQNKFYHADGYQYMPFAFSKLAKGADAVGGQSED